MYTKFKLMLIVIVMTTGIASAQNKWYNPLFEKNDWIVYSNQFLSGAFSGVREEVLYHPTQLFEIHPNLNRQWWDSRISFKNKYTESPLLVAFSDANHFFKSAGIVTNCISIGFSFGDISSIPKRDRWKFIAKKILFSYAANKLGFGATYYLLYRNQLQL